MADHAEQTTSKAIIVAAEPELFVANIEASLDFFTRKLGFAKAFTYGEPPFCAQVKRDGARLNLRCVDSPVINPELRDREELLSAAMTVATAHEIKQLFLELQSANVTFFQTLKKQPWGASNFIIKDLDGNLLLFAGPPTNRREFFAAATRAATRNEIRCRVNRDLRFRRGELHCLVRESFEQLDLLEAERSRRSAGYDQDPEGRARVHQRHGHDGPVVARLLRLSLGVFRVGEDVGDMDCSAFECGVAGGAAPSGHERLPFQKVL
jgi:uncharacterized glyoxalase superfamily protein PhnB